MFVVNYKQCTLYFYKNGVIGISEESFLDAKNRRKIVNELLLLAKNNLLNDEEKKKVIDIINCFKQKTDKQIERFILYYNLNDDRNYNFSELAKIYNCSPSSIRTSVNKIGSKIFFLKDERMDIIKNIVIQSKKGNNIE